MKIPKGINQKHDDELFNRTFKPLDDEVDELGKYISPTYENIVNEVTKRLIRYIKLCRISVFKRNNRLYLVDEINKSLLDKPYETIVNLITSGTGMGKTFLSLVFAKYLIINCQDIDGVVFLCQEYENGVDQIEKEIKKLRFLDHVVIYRGKNNACLQKATVINKNKNTIGDFLKQGFDIEFYCKNCPKRNECEAIKSHDKLFIQECKSFVGVQSQINAVLPIYFKTFSPTIILFIDEDMESALEKEEKINENTLTNNIDYLTYEIRREYKRKKSNVNYIEYLKSLKEVLTILREGIDDEDSVINYDQLDWLFSEFEYFGNNYKDDFIKKLKDNLQFSVKENRRELFNQVYNLIIDLIQNYEIENDENYYPNYEPEKWINAVIKKRKGYKNEREFLLININFINKINTIKFADDEYILKIIHNDATADKGILQAFYGKTQLIIQHYGSSLDYKKIKFLQFRIPRRRSRRDGLRISQYGKSSWSYGTLTEGTLNTLLGYFEIIVDYYCVYKLEEILGIARNIIAKWFKKESMREAGIDLKEIIKSYNEFIKWDEYPITGTNIYKDINTVVILMKPDLKEAECKRKSILYHTTPEYYRKYYIEKNIKQAYGRIMRGDNVKTVIIFTGYVLFTKEFIENNKIDIYYLKSKKAIENYFKILKYQDIIIEYLKKNNTISTSECATFLNESIGFTREILIHLEIEKILDHRADSIGHRHIYFLKE